MSAAMPPHTTLPCQITCDITTDGQLCIALGESRWQSHGPLAVLHYYDRRHPRAQIVAAPSTGSYAYGTSGTISQSCQGQFIVSSLAEDRLLVTLHFDAIAVSIHLHIAVRPNGITVTIPDDGIGEEQPSLYRVLGLEILPEFGAATTGETGYLLLPNWFGCQCFFDKDYPREVWQTIYSANDQWEHACNMPVFGITRAQGTLCGLVTAGDLDAQLVCRQHWERQQINSIHPYLVYRWQQQDARITGTRQVQYTVAPPHSADGEGYVFCGKTYRAWLQDRGLRTWAEKGDERPEALEYAGRFFLKLFMAYKEPQADGQGTYHIGCTFAEAQQILADCVARGMTHLTVILAGWGQDGHDGKCPTYLPPDARLGGEEGVRRLIAWCRAHDIQLGVHTSHTGAYACSPEFSREDVIRHRSGEQWVSIVWSGGQSYRICPAVSLVKHVARDLPRLAALGVHGHHHYDAEGSFELCYAPQHPVTDRAAYVALVREQFKIALRTMGSVSTEMPFGPYFDVVDGFYHSYLHPYAWHLASPIGRYFYDRSVPLLTVALHGSCHCGQAMAPGAAWRLEMLDMGTTPQSEVSMRPCRPFGIPAYADVADQLAETYDFFFGAQGVLPRIGQAAITARREVAPLVTETWYDNGLRVRVNRSSEAYGDLAPMSYRIETTDTPGTETARPYAQLAADRG